jgi:hypothetical protein
LLPATMAHVGAHFMPMRVWGAQVKPFVTRLLAGAPAGQNVLLETEFMESSKPYGIRITDKAIFTLMKSKDARRALRLMRGEQVKMRKAELGERATAAQDPCNVTMSALSRNGRLGTGRGGAGLTGEADADGVQANSAMGMPLGYVAVKLGLDTTDQAKLDRALSLLVHGTGLEIYAKGFQQRALAKEVGREYFSQVRAETAARRDQVRQQIAAAGAASAEIAGTADMAEAAPTGDRDAAAANDVPLERAAA